MMRSHSPHHRPREDEKIGGYSSKRNDRETTQRENGRGDRRRRDDDDRRGRGNGADQDRYRDDRDRRGNRRGDGRREPESQKTNQEEPRWGKERDRDYDRDRGDKERRKSRDRLRERDRDRAGSSRRSASPPSRLNRHSRRSASRSRSHSQPDSPPPVDKAKPNFAPSGLLAAETNTVKATNGASTILKYNEPPEARKPILGWRLYVFKGSEQVEMLHIHRQSAYLIGRDRLVADIPIDHPSCSKQHCVIQHRRVQQKDELGNSKGVIKPFIIDLESTNGTHVNDERIPESRFYELKAGDVLKFGQSNREYVLLHDEAS